MVYFFETVFRRFFELIKAPLNHPEMIWITLPLIVVLFMMTLYFARYREEELGWNTALSNSLVLIFVSLDLFRTIFNTTTPGSFYNFMDLSWSTFLIFSLFFYGFFLMYANFSHIFPKRVSYFMSSSLMVNLLAYVMIALIYSKIVIDVFTFVSIGLFFVLLLIIFTTIGFISKRWWYRIEHMRSVENFEDIKKEKQHLEKEKKHIKEGEKKIKRALKEGKNEIVQKRRELKKIKEVALKHRNGKIKKRKSVKSKTAKKKSSKEKKEFS